MVRVLLSLTALCCACVTRPQSTIHADSSSASIALKAACGDAMGFREALLEAPDRVATGAAGALQRWSPPRPVAPEDRAIITDALRLYLRRCGLDEAVALTRKLVSFATVRAEQPPAGPAFTAMAAFLADWSSANGLTFKSHRGNEVWEVWLGEAAPPAHVAFITHGDVAPAQEPGAPQPEDGSLPAGWTTPPFEAVLKGERLYGRGTEDDKGPLATGLVVQKALAAFGLTPSKPVVSIIGTGEEFSWEAFRAWVNESPPPRYPISLDSSYPVVAAESGFVRWVLRLPRELKFKRAEPKDCLKPTDARAGAFLTQVPGEATLTLKRTGEKTAPPSASPDVVVEASGDGATVRANGEAVHSSVADTGRNALWALARYAGNAPLCDGGITRALDFVRTALVDDHYGHKLGIHHAHEFMGPLLVAPTLLRVEGDAVTLSVNMRRPAGLSREAFEKKVRTVLSRLKKEISAELEEVELYVSDPAIADLGGRLVPTLLRIYAAHTGANDARPVSIRGGTYARLFPGAVSFGPALPGKPYRGHAPDEYIELEQLRMMLALNLEAIVALDSPEGP